MEALRPVRRTLLRDTAYAAIRDAIVRGELPPGDAVRDADLAERLGLSRAPVREALARLAEEGLVESKPQSYTRVTRLEPRAVREAAVVVRAMHELAVRAAVPRLTAEDVAVMREANRRFESATRAGVVGEALRAGDELRDVLVRACGNRAVAATIARHTPLIRRLEWQQFAAERALRSAGLHERLIDACAEGDADGAAGVTARIWRALEELADDPGERNVPDEPPELLEPNVL
ncbi:GntR family transcriptional regulator [Streptomyces sp. NBC_01142]|uniref:GntR family transcriptional regulator n=1 Tax=Streptomyces sp. NBC_01142 TaxID=2975865 RepID=UPI002255165C|nr:GntR family transcriptional regulator [Streptomyces sp. NBC_01142]MCX4822243.1 GntR family transcriptional regulator [Streptomyces sp. NBC_01142]